MIYNYSNHTLFGIKSSPERYAFVSWVVFVVLCSFIGDTSILIASIKYKALKLHSVMITFIQHLAVCDLLNSLGNFFPSIISALANCEYFGEEVRYFRFWVTYYNNTVSIGLICAMTLTKLLLIKYPLRTAAWHSQQANKVCGGIWVVSVCVPSLHILVDKHDVIFDFRVYSCMYAYSSDVWKVLLPLTAVLIVYIPTITIIAATALLLREAVRVARSQLRWQGIMTVVLTAAVYTLSFLPYGIYCMAEPLVVKNPLTPGYFYTYYYRMTWVFVSFNVLANFFIYSLTVTSFRAFLKTKMGNVMSSVYRSSSNSDGRTTDKRKATIQASNLEEAIKLKETSVI